MKTHGCGVVGCMSADSIHHNKAFGGPPFTPGAGESRIEFDSRWIEFTLSSDTTKTFRWKVRTKGHVIIGEIKWYSQWRGYAFFPLHNTLFEPTCLLDIAAFIKARMADRRDYPKRPKGTDPLSREELDWLEGATEFSLDEDGMDDPADARRILKRLANLKKVAVSGGGL